jgi:hypothetical protein
MLWYRKEHDTNEKRNTSPHESDMKGDEFWEDPVAYILTFASLHGG